MPLIIVRNDITKMKCDAIVNAANRTLLGGGGVDGAIHRAAGKGLLLECMKLGGCKVGAAKITGGHKLPCRYVIHTVGPKWRGGGNNEKEQLESCYRESLCLARDHKCESVAFPLISSGVYGYPKDLALRVAVDAIGAFLAENEMTVYLVIFDRASYQIGGKIFADIQAYIDDNYADEHMRLSYSRRRYDDEAMPCDLSVGAAAPAPCVSMSVEPKPLEETMTLEEAIGCIDESFSQMLLRKIDEKGMTDAQCYKKANVDRKLFSKIRNNPDYRPAKVTAIAFAIALELDLAQTSELLMKAGYALSHSSKFDIIIEYFISNRNYNVFEINEALFAFDQNLLGA